MGPADWQGLQGGPSGLPGLRFSSTQPSDPRRPRELIVYPTPHAENLQVSGRYLYLAEGYRGLKVLDCGAQGGPRVVSACDSLYAVDVAVQGEYALVVDSASLKAVHVLVPEWLR